MTGRTRRPGSAREVPRALLVEGPDDMHTVIQLLFKHRPTLAPMSWFALPDRRDAGVGSARAVDAIPDDLRRFDATLRRSKAIVHTFLAWQAEPGKPYGQGIRAGYLATAHPLAAAFVAWLEAVFGPAPTAP